MSDPNLAATPVLGRFVHSVRAIVGAHREPERVCRLVAERLAEALVQPDLLTEEQCRADASRYRQHVLHVDQGGRFSVVSLVWLPGQCTPIHDHVSWCVTGVYRGREHETRYRVERGEGGGAYLVESGRQVNAAGVVSPLCPPGDIHRVGADGAETAVSIHVYGANIAELGSSIRRTYDLEVRSPAPL